MSLEQVGPFHLGEYGLWFLFGDCVKYGKDGFDYFQTYYRITILTNIK